MTSCQLLTQHLRRDRPLLAHSTAPQGSHMAAAAEQHVMWRLRTALRESTDCPCCEALQA